jgi:hypothetical protein
VLTRFAAFRNRLYARMEEVSFRASMAVLGGVVAVAVIVAGTSLALSQAPAPVRSAAISPAPVSPSAAPSSAPPPSAASPSRPAATATPARTKAPAPERAVTYAGTDADASSSQTYSGSSDRRAGSQRHSHAAAFWGRSGAGFGRHSGFGGHGFGGFGFGGHGGGHR